MFNFVGGPVPLVPPGSAPVYDIDLAINEFNENSIINLALFGTDKYHKETYFLTVSVLLISKLLKALMNHF